jgi:capsular polysaccharide export protein
VQPFLRVPPFPGASLKSLHGYPGVQTKAVDLSQEVRVLRVGGAYWGAQPDFPAGSVLARFAAAVPFAKSLSGDVVLWDPAGLNSTRSDVLVMSEECDPWHMLEACSAVVLTHDDEVRVIAALLGVPRYLLDENKGELDLDLLGAGTLLDRALPETLFENPFTGEAMDIAEAVGLCGFWRRLIDGNRDIVGGLGFASWKRSHVGPLLWNGSQPFKFVGSRSKWHPNRPIAVWRSKLSQAALAGLAKDSVPLIEVEDGFLRSQGLGADCIPPLSLTIDRVGAHFDPSGPSELEQLLEDGEFNEPMLKRARDLKQVIVTAGVSKYARGIEPLDRPAGKRRHILVPGQVEDDRSVQTGGCGLVSNLELLTRVRQQEPDAYLIYKPHPDVIAGHRPGAISNRKILEVADQVVSDVSMASLIEMVDEVHVNTSLAGFEALLRGRAVTTYGVPFYAGWGLTKDLGPVPSRRTARRTLDELVAATLLIYPRYFDPVTGLPCPAEVVVARLCATEPANKPIVEIRRLQGKVMRCFRSLVQ